MAASLHTGVGRARGVKSLDLLERLVGFPTVSLSSNRNLIDFIRSTLNEAGVAVVEV